jgi:ubiquinone biosynthesis protein UbiJ
MTAPVLLPAAAEGLANRLLALDPEAAQRLESLRGKTVAIEVSGLDLTLYVLLGREVLVLGSLQDPPDLTLRGAPLALARMARGEIGFGGDVEVRGDIQLAGRLQTILELMDLDWEEQAARLVGDIPAHQAGNLVRGASEFLRRTAETLGLDLEDYLKEELRLLPQRFEVEELAGAIDQLRDDEERLAARIRRLERRRGAEYSDSL